MKQEHQAELKEKIKEGVKPSDLKKLKRSRSAGDIPKAPPLPTSTPLVKSKSAEQLETTPSKIEQLETQITVLELKLEVQKREIQENQASQAFLKDQLQTKQQALEQTQANLEQACTQITGLNQALEQSLIARYQSLSN
jgi:septal ring factor EnvC (AmiA/AmiB activator)